MQYMGGKSDNARAIAGTINLFRGARMFWDPFCGGLSMPLALGGAGIISDIHPALIALYCAVACGWNPPAAMSESEYIDARSLPPSDPRNGFAGFGCSYGGRYFQGYGRSKKGDLARATRNALLRDIPRLISRGCLFACVDFLTIPAFVANLIIYCDPSYRGTKNYPGTPPFNYPLFWRRCQEWAAVGVPVFVSEYVCPVPNHIVWGNVKHQMQMFGGTHPERREEYLFRIH